MNQQPIVVLGAGGMGRESLTWIHDAYPGREVLGFLDDGRLPGEQVCGLPLLGASDWAVERDVGVVAAIGSPKQRQQAAARLQSDGVALVTIVHPTAYVGPGVTLGTGAIVCPNVTLTRDVEVGVGVILNYGCQVGHDGAIGDFALIAPGVALAGNVTVAEGAWVGIGASVVEGVTIGSWSTVGAGSAVVGDIPADVTAVGVPCRPANGGA